MKKLLIHACCLAAVIVNAWSQQASPTPDVPEAKISQVKVLPGGGLLFAIRLYASKTKPLKLMRPPPKIKPGQVRVPGDTDPQPFSLAGSTLQDLYTQKVYPCLNLLPNSPYFGPMDVTGEVAPGGWYQQGVAFPAIPPPHDKEGKKQPLLLLFSIHELKIETHLKLDPDKLKLLG